VLSVNDAMTPSAPDATASAVASVLILTHAPFPLRR
jgi:hypothetical protein